MALPSETTLPALPQTPALSLRCTPALGTLRKAKLPSVSIYAPLGGWAETGGGPKMCLTCQPSTERETEKGEDFPAEAPSRKALYETDQSGQILLYEFLCTLIWVL